MSPPAAGAPSRYRRLILVVEVTVAPDALDGEIAGDVAVAIELGGITDLRSCAVAMPHLPRATS